MTNAAHLKSEKDGSIQKMTFVVRAKEIEDSGKQLRQSITMLENKLEAQESAITLAEHDMRNNLGSIISILNILEQINPTQEQLKWIKMIKDIGYDMINLLKASNDYTKMENGDYKPDLSSFDLIGVLNKELDLFRDNIVSKNMITKLIYNGEEKNFEDFKFGIKGDLFYIHRLFKNLINNAVEASGPNKFLEICIEDQNDFKITIHNDGLIPKALRNNFFEKYTTHGKTNGTGLGTFIAKLITQQHDGKITFTTGEEDGTKIIIKFPKSMIVSN